MQQQRIAANPHCHRKRPQQQPMATWAEHCMDGAVEAAEKGRIQRGGQAAHVTVWPSASRALSTCGAKSNGKALEQETALQT